ncbi:MAG: Sporulation Domain-Containing Protein [Chitinophagaceae bacterium]|nr:Sporulation Domain-Containing Protein [Chitinophagaceae bacterium]
MIAINFFFSFKNYRCNNVLSWRNIILVLLLFKPGITHCQADDEIIVSVNVQRIGSVELPAIIHNEIVYLPVKQIFDFLKIKNTLSSGLDTEEGFFINPKSTFFIDKNKSHIVYQGKTFSIKPGDLIRTETNLYLRSDHFGNVFGLQCAYSFRDLSVTISTTLELPAIIELRQQQMRQNINKLNGEIKADTIIKRSFPLFHLGAADWLVNSIQENNVSNTSLNLNIGAIVAGGETNLFLNYNSNIPFKFKEQYYRWRYVNNNNAILKQVTLGKIFTQATSSVYAPVTGVQFTNTPTTYRKSYGTYTVSDKTEPGSIVELYINNALVNYTRADASGFYTFEIPLVYGNSIIKLRFYGTSGEENTREQYITIPFNFIPLHQVEYTLTAGIVDDNQKSRFLRGVVNYGLTRHITFGGGAEYLSSVIPGKAMPFLTASMQVTSNLLLSGEYTYGVRSKGIMSYRLPSNIQFDLNYIKYSKGQTAIKNSYLEEKKAVVSVPFRGKNFRGLSRFTVNQFVLPKYKYTNAEFLLSGVIWGVSSNVTTYAQITGASRPTVYSNLSFAFRLPHGLKITPQIKYEYDQQKISMVRFEAEKKIFKQGFMNVSYEKNTAANNQYIAMALRYNFSFAQTSLSARQSNNTTTTTQSARGSMVIDKKTNYFAVNNQTNVGKGGIIILPFLDLNGNGQREPNEPKIADLKFHINGGHIERDKRDTIIRVLGLDAYMGYYLELDNGFDNIAWEIKKKKIKIFIDPNHHTLVQIPITVMGEVSGKVYHKSDKGINGIGRITVNFYNSHLQLIAQTLTEADGYFNFLGFAPGKYTAQVDAEQLKKLQMVSSPVLSFTILPNKEGDVVEGLKFTLQTLTGGCKVDARGLLKDSDGDGVPDCQDKELITPASCQPVDADGVGKCILPGCCKL